MARRGADYIGIGVRALIVVSIVTFAILGYSSSPASALQTPIPLHLVLTVTKLTDTDDGKCDEDCSLREAIDTATSGVVISFAANVTGTLSLNKEILLTASLSIEGLTSKTNKLFISSNNRFRMFVIRTPITVNISSLHAIGGNDNYTSGGFIDNEGGTVVITNSIIENHQATSGGAILNGNGTLTIRDSTFKNNHATSGGAIANGGILTIVNSTFQDNQSTGGGVIYNHRGIVIITNSTFQGNHANSGGAIFNIEGAVKIVNSTFEGNSLSGSGSIFNYVLPNTKSPGSVEIKNTILEGSSGNVTCEGAVIDRGNNLQFPHGDCGANIPVGDPKLGPLQDNGGSTFTMMPQAGSAAIGKIIDDSCATTDQRGVARKTGAACDIGAVKYDEPSPPESPTPPIASGPTNTVAQ